MIQRIFFILLGAIPLQSFAQYFSGELHYQLKIVPKLANLDIDSLMALQPGTESIYLITDKYYKSTYFKNGEQTYSYTYHDETKRIYDEIAGKGYITFRDSRKGNTKFIGSAHYKDSVTVVAGHQCFLAKIIYDDYTSRKFYTTDLRINPDSFKGHEVGDWYQQIKDVNGALSLKTITEYPSHFEVQEVVRLVERPVLRQEFKVPDKEVVASYSALDKQVSLKTPTQANRNCYLEKVNKARNKIQIYSFTSYVEIIVSETGALTHIEPYEKDEYGLFEFAVDIIKNCGLEFSPGQIDNKSISSMVYFPIEF